MVSSILPSPTLSVCHDDGSVEAYDLVLLVLGDFVDSPFRPQRSFGGRLLHKEPLQKPLSGAPIDAFPFGPLRATGTHVLPPTSHVLQKPLSGAPIDAFPFGPLRATGTRVLPPTSHVLQRDLSSGSCPPRSNSGSDTVLSGAPIDAFPFGPLRATGTRVLPPISHILQRDLSSGSMSTCPPRSSSESDMEVERLETYNTPLCPSTRKRWRDQTKIAWTREEDATIEVGILKWGCKWSRIAGTLASFRTDDAVRNRWHRLQRKQVKKALRGRAGPSLLPLLVAGGLPLVDADEEETDKQGDMWTPEEDLVIDHAVRVQGLRWKSVAAVLPGRSDSGCRNRWVRSQQRILTSMGLPAKGAADIFAALRVGKRFQKCMAPVLKGPEAMAAHASAQPIAGW